MTRIVPSVLLAFCLLSAACGSGPSADGDALAMRVDTVGDTIVVRTLGGSVWGPDVRPVPVLRIGELEGPEEYTFGRIVGVAVTGDGRVLVLDNQARTVRVFDPDGRHVRDVGRPGGGPGELAGPTGLALHPDGRILVSDPNNARVTLFTADGEPETSWLMGGSFVATDQLRATRDGRVYVVTMIGPMNTSGTLETGWARVGPDGTPPDTIRRPAWDFEPARLVATFERDGGSSISMRGVPFAPGAPWTLSHQGHVVGGVATRYAIDSFHPDGHVLRIERAAEPVPVSAGERAFQEHAATSQLRQTDPSWRWSGPAIPATKAPFSRVHADEDGRIWVQVPAPGQVVPVEERLELTSGQPGPQGPPPWREPIVYDVFDAEGRFLGTVPMPHRFSWQGARDDQVWGVQRDELDVEYVVLLRIDGVR